MKNAHEFDGLYDDLFDFPNAGYVMIDVGSPWANSPSGFVRDVQYVSEDPTKYWMKGLLESWHVTARGPLDPKVRQEHCRRVLDFTVLPDRLSLGHVEIFPSPYPEDQYDCFVINVNDPKLWDINTQLSILPGVQTYIPYKPHITLGYFKSGHRQELLAAFKDNLVYDVKVKGYDFGRMKK